jgi:hypothetical protein
MLFDWQETSLDFPTCTDSSLVVIPARDQITERSGFAVLAALSAGDYQLHVQAHGFSDYEPPLTLTVGRSHRFRLS